MDPLTRPTSQSRTVVRVHAALAVVSLAVLPVCSEVSAELASECERLPIPSDTVLWCDDFENTDLPSSGRVEDNYYDFSDAGGSLRRVSTEAKSGRFALEQHYRRAGAQSAGYFSRTFGKSPVSSQSHSDRRFREIYWRFYVKHPSSFAGFPSKLTRATVFAAKNRAQAMIAHVWLESDAQKAWLLDPASGTDKAGSLRSTRWNDFANLRWLGRRKGKAAIARGQWQCVEVHVALNDPARANGRFSLWVDGVLSARASDLNWLGDFQDFGINAVMIESYWNAGSPAVQSRYIDSLIIAEQRIGCHSDKRPARISALSVEGTRQLPNLQ